MPSRSSRALTLFACAALALAGAATVAAGNAYAASTVTNPGFESNGASQTPTGWSESGTVAGAKSEAGGHGGSYQLAHWASSAYTVETYQTLTGLTTGWYTLRAWVRSGGGQNSAYLGLRNCGGSTVTTPLPLSPSSWVQIAVSAQVTSTSCTISLYSNGNANNWANFDDITFTSGQAGISIKGGDVSTLKKGEDKGGVYYNSSGTQQDALTILRNAGMNYARFKVWVNPADGYNNKARVLTMAARAKALGMKILIDFHYSDGWADPGQQTKPAAWSSYSVAQLTTAVYNHTYDVLNALKAQGTTADMVQIGNEINAGMLWPEGSTSNWSNLTGFLKAGYNATKAVSGSTLVALHLAKGGDNAGTRWFFDNVVSYGVSFDVIALSYYNYWHGTLADLQTNVNDVASRYSKPIVITETAYGFTLAEKDAETNIFTSSLQAVAGYPATPAGQAQAFRDVFSIIQAIPNGRGLGVFYWEPTWTAVTGNGWDPTNASSGDGWENQALFDYSSKALTGITVFGAV